MITNEPPLESWKEIAAYLGRQVKTVQRWEKEEGLPVHRHSHKSRSSVYAYPSEIDAWRAGRKVAAEPVPRPLWKIPAFALTMVLCLIMVGNGVRPVAAQQARGVTKRLCVECPTDSTITLDGRWMANVDSGDVAVRDLSTGKETRLTKAVDPENADWAILSPDLRQVAFGWETADKPSHFQLRLIANAPGSTPKVVLDNPEFDYFDPIDWSRDGRSVLIEAEKPDRTWQFVWVSTADGSVKALKSLDWRLGGGGSLSPDGRYIAYAALPVNPKAPLRRNQIKDTHIYVLAADGSSETVLVKEAGINAQPTWTPDGSHLLFTGDRSGKFDLWSLGVQNGKAAGAPSRVVADIGQHFSMGLTRTGSYYYRVQDNIEYVTLTGASGGSAQAQRFVGVNAAWSPDGKSIAFKRHYTGDPEAYDLVVRSLETGDERKYTTNLGFTRNGEPQWLHDGNSIGEGISRGNGTTSVPYRVDLKTGEFKPFPESLSELSTGDRIVYGARPDPKDPAHVPDRIVKLDRATGQETQILTMPEPGPTFVSLAPDGRTLAIVRRPPQGVQERKTHFARVAIDGSGYREIYTMDRGDLGNQLTWTRDGRSIVFPERQEDKWRIMRLPAEGGTPEYTGLEVKAIGMRRIEVSPDGSRIAFSSLERGISVWVLDNVMASLK